jgi:hypothetical protein
MARNYKYVHTIFLTLVSKKKPHFPTMAVVGEPHSKVKHAKREHTSADTNGSLSIFFPGCWYHPQCKFGFYKSYALNTGDNLLHS